MQEAKTPYKPRPQFLPFHNRDKRWAVLVCHRRAGKTVALINELIGRAIQCRKPDAQFAYVAPILKQAKRAAWGYLKRDSKFICTRANESELYVELTNGAKIFILGADDPDNARGLYFDGIVLDELAQIKPSYYTSVIRPALADRKGWAVFSGTPNGKDNLLWKRFIKAQEDPKKYFLLHLPASSYKLPKALAQEIEEMKEDMSAEEIAQEFECSFDAALVGSYYGENIAALQKNNKIVDRDLYEPNKPVSLAIDLGYNDALAVWFWQISRGELRFVDYFERTGMDADDLIKHLHELPYKYETIWLPHDAFHRTFQSKKSVFDTFVGAGLPVRRAPDPDEGNRVFHGIHAVRRVLRKFPVWFSMKRCRDGIEALKNYSHEWNAKAGQFNDKPKHDRWSHGADAFRYACLSIQWEDIQRSLDEDLPLPGVPVGNIINIGWTLNDALKAHDRQLARQRNQGRQRI